MPQQGSLVSQQYMSVLVNGPDGANTLFIASGLMRCGLSQNNPTGSGNALEETFAVILDQPQLGPGQFRRAIASASLAGINGAPSQPAAPGSSALSWYVTSAEADLDDETGRIQLMVDLHVGVAFGTAEIAFVSFQVMTSAAV
jgi:hypothetical protein